MYLVWGPISSNCSFGFKLDKNFGQNVGILISRDQSGDAGPIFWRLYFLWNLNQSCHESRCESCFRSVWACVLLVLTTTNHNCLDAYHLATNGCQQSELSENVKNEESFTLFSENWGKSWISIFPPKEFGHFSETLTLLTLLHCFCSITRTNLVAFVSVSIFALGRCYGNGISRVR